MMKGLLLAAGAVAAASNAMAADAIPTAAASGFYNWTTEICLGGHGGSAQAESDFAIAITTTPGHNSSFAFLQGGFTYQSGNFVLGFQTDVSFDQDTQAFLGWVGVAMTLDERWSLTAEYLRTDSSTFNPTFISSRALDLDMDVVKLGMTYKFD